MKTDDYIVIELKDLNSAAAHIVHSLKAAQRVAKSTAKHTRKIMIIVKIVDIEISES